MSQILAWLSAHGGIVAVVGGTLLVVLTILSSLSVMFNSLSQLLSKPGLGAIGAKLASICAVMVKILDFIGMNKAHVANIAPVIPLSVVEDKKQS